MIREALFTANPRRGFRASVLGMARPATSVAEVGLGEQLVAAGAETMTGYKMVEQLTQVGEVQVADPTVCLLMANGIMIAQAVGVIEPGEVLAVPAEKVQPRPSGLDTARPAALVAEVECGEQLAADGAGTMSGLEMAVVLNRVGEVQVAETTVHLGMAIDVVGAQAVSVVELEKIHAVPTAKVAG